MKMKGFFAVLLALLCVAASVPWVSAAEVDSDTVYCFASTEFAGEEKLAGICITALPDAAAGTVIAANDVKDIPDWAYEAVEYAAKHSFLITSSYNLTPNANAKRAELAVLLQRFCNNVLQLDAVDER